MSIYVQKTKTVETDGIKYPLIVDLHGSGGHVNGTRYSTGGEKLLI